MQSLRAQALLLCLLVIGSAGCGASGSGGPGGGGGGGGPTPTVGPTLSPGPHFYTTDGQSPGHIYVWNIPLSSTSTPALVVNTTGNVPYNMCFDNANHMVVTFRNTTEVFVYNLPLTASSVPAFVLSMPGGSTDCHFDPSGNLYVAGTNTNNIAVFTAPVSASSTISSNIVANVNGPWGVSADANHVYVSNLTNETMYSNLAGGNALQATFSTQFDNYGIIVGPDGNLYVSNVIAANEIDLFHFPITNSSTPDPAHRIMVQPNTPSHCITYISFDSSGNLYIVGSDDVDPTFNHIYVYAPPYTTQTLNLSTGTIKLRGDQVGP
ncbi:MAG: hypothetical protein JO219_12590 [Candidatus Eremiobacteraeota bacterium]|nr:hypothetical protein [Candidatus Eremiobacteraeota bacterium]MBV8366314.1 hypothetical protein [Candidatus Eremiobacteraeota bacterium]